MSLIFAIIFGIIQGVTEFLPVSSSAHLAIMGALTKIKDEDALPFFLTLHFGTLIALIIFFKKELVCIFKGLIKREKEVFKTIFLLFFTTLFTGIIGVSLRKNVEKTFTSITFPAIFLIVTAILLFSTFFFKEKNFNISSMSYLSAIFIGFAQGLAVFPGISRSGATIVASLVVGLSKKEAFNYSFFASIPAIGGAFLLEIKEIGNLESNIGVIPIMAGFIASLIFGYLSLIFLRRMVISGKLYYFGFYSFLVGMFTLFFVLR